MSNQVYINHSGDKFFTYPATNSYEPLNTSVTVGSPAVSNVVFRVVNEEKPNLIEIFDNGAVHVKEAGMYSFTCYISVTAPISITSRNILFIMQLENTTSFNNYIVDQVDIWLPDIASAVTLVQSVSWTGYFGFNEGFYIKIQNASVTDISYTRAGSALTCARIY